MSDSTIPKLRVTIVVTYGDVHGSELSDLIHEAIATIEAPDHTIAIESIHTHSIERKVL